MKSELIKEGDEITNSLGLKGVLTAVWKSRYGLVIKVEDGIHIWSVALIIPELLPIERVYDYYGWIGRGYIVLSNGQKLGTVSTDPLRTVAEYDIKWKETLKLMEEENVPLSSLQEFDIIRPVY